MMATSNDAKSQSNTEWTSRGDFGGVGLLQTRTARSARDGEVNVGYSYIYPYKRYYLTLQALPWLEGTFRYTEISNRLYSNFLSFSGTQTYKDRGADIKVRLLKESKYFPEVAFAFQDGLGTGLFSAEYLVANKRFHDLDFSVGMGWGYPASGSAVKNPFTSLSDVFSSRTGAGGGRGGKFTIGNYFSGETIGLFGGVSYNSPIDGLVFKLEYETNDYQTEPLSGTLDQSLRWNMGFAYKPIPWFEFSFAHERGEAYMFRGAMIANLHDEGMPKFDPPPVPVNKRQKKQADKMVQGSVPPGATTLKGKQSNLLVAHGSNEPELHTRVPTSEIAALNIKSVPASTGNDDFTDGEIEDARIVEYLFDEFEAAGASIENIQLSHSSAEIQVSKLAPGNEQRNIRLARTVFQSIPGPIKAVSLVGPDGDGKTQRLAFGREEIDRETAISDFFDLAEVSGLKIKSVELEHDRATLRVATPGGTLPLGFSNVAETISEMSPLPLDEVNIIKMQNGQEKTKISIHRQRMQANKSIVGWAMSSSGQSKITDQLVLSPEEKREIANRIFAALNEEKFVSEGILFDGLGVTVYGTPRRFRQFARNIGRSARRIVNNLPAEFEEITVVSLSAGMEVNRVTIFRKGLEDAAAYKGSAEEIFGRAKIEGSRPGIFLPDEALRNWNRYPSFRWSLSPHIRSHVGGPDQFVLYQFWAAAGATLDVWRGLTVSGLIGRDLFNNFDKIKLESDSQLPKVRSNIKHYLQQGTNNLVRLQTDYMFSPMKDWYGRVSAGYFEEMYGGWSAEILHRPFNSRFAVGGDINKLTQRDFDQRFTFRDYEILTGHLSVYYDIPWNNLLGSIDVGRYLAGDTGITFNISRRFDSGVGIGVWATLTDVSADEFGEGSFDKGFSIIIPFDLFLTNSTTRVGAFNFRPLFRDGGQKVSVKNRLYDVTGAANYREVVHDWHRLLD